MPRPTAILLDALGTLLKLDPPAPALRAELARRAGVEVTEAQAARALAAEIVFYRSHLQEGRDAAALARLRARCAEVLRGALPAGERLAALRGAEMTDVLLAALHFSPFPDAAAALRTARQRGMRLVVVSNWDCSLHEVLARTGLTEWLDGVVTSAEAGAPKPAPEIFARALDLARATPAEALHVGDSLREDIHGARAAGIRAVLVCRPPDVAPDGVESIATLEGLSARLDAP